MGQRQKALFSGKPIKGDNKGDGKPNKGGGRGKNARWSGDNCESCGVMPKPFAEKQLMKEKKKGTPNEKISDDEKMVLQYRRFYCNHFSCRFWKEHNALSSVTKMKAHWVGSHGYTRKKYCQFSGKAILDNPPKKCVSFDVDCPMCTHNSLTKFYDHLRELWQKDLDMEQERQERETPGEEK